MKAGVVCLWLALSLSGLAETLGTLGQIQAGRATFLEGSEAHTYEVPADLARRLEARGLGSRWEYSALGSKLAAALERGSDSNVSAAMQTLSQFVRAINGQKWPEAAKLTAPAQTPDSLAGAWARYTLSPHVRDWALLELKPNRVVLSIQSTQGAFYDEASGTLFTNEFTLVQQGYRWYLESSR